jgi:hypothetical protein
VKNVVAIAEGEESAGHVVFPIYQLRQAHGAGETEFDFPQSLLGVFALGDVLRRAGYVD